MRQLFIAILVGFFFVAVTTNCESTRNVTPATSVGGFGGLGGSGGGK